MQDGYFWPINGDQDEVCFIYTDRRAHWHVSRILNDRFSGTIVSGYSAYASFAQQNEAITSAQHWVHTQRYFFNAQDSEPVAAAETLDLIGVFYRHEARIKEQALDAKQTLKYRIKRSKPVVDYIFAWVRVQRQREDRSPMDPFKKALVYLSNREELSVFMTDAEVPLDTNHLERQIQPIPMGCRNCLSCWTELGTKHVGVIQSLINTCKLHGDQSVNVSFGRDTAGAKSTQTTKSHN